MVEIIMTITIIMFVLFYIGLFIVAINNISFLKRKRKNLSRKINGLSQKALERKILLSERWFTFRQIKENRNLLDFLSHGDLHQFRKKGDLFAERKDSLKNIFIRNVFNLPAEALQRKIELSSGENFKLADFKRKPWVLNAFSKKDFKRFPPENGLFRLRVDPKRIAIG
jgi:hypothetical protein